MQRKSSYLQAVVKQFAKNPPNHHKDAAALQGLTLETSKMAEMSTQLSTRNSRRSTYGDYHKKSVSNTPQNKDHHQNLSPSPLMQQQMRKEKKFDINDFIALEENYEDLCKLTRKTFQNLNQMLRGFGSDEVKEYLDSIWDIDPSKKEPKDIFQLIELIFNVITRFYIELEDSLYVAKKGQQEVKDNNSQNRDYVLLLQKQEGEIRALTRENQQLKLSINLYQEKLKNSEIQSDLLANYAQKEMENLKQDFQFAINDLRQKEEDVEILKQELKNKSSQLESMEERLVSVFILEHKIKALGAKNAKDIEKTIFEYSEKLREMDKSSREALRKERQENESKVLDFRNKLNLLTMENRKLQLENKSRIQQLNDIIKEKDEYLQKKVCELQNIQERLALRNKEVYLIAQQKDKYGNMTNSESFYSK
ncbi:hypothetical protein TTHERM_00448670 (macronuclear) [Tetrahymena thermophila SB210]|uniref:Uncharacterized protein n=1 Tax=Tetrahymena thermophila (strain SB210) TaxID=312017 RepID=Q239E8_TETTS|nr:hypothetical protein TTHERM_00448670 [Tetrahymena thermophila SB210]EAR93022.2 hypothetical protein TTHERM_00448670 [Tetrahymena thermophila SB210]|eukprot:XP_001013267.2 hypothetical protein TTHERM_00448670 [Tetrahymena thermophila SB210]